MCFNGNSGIFSSLSSIKYESWTMILLIRQCSITFVSANRFFTLKNAIDITSLSSLITSKFSYYATATQAESIESFDLNAADITEETSRSCRALTLVPWPLNQNISNLRTEYEFQHPRYSQFLAAHFLAEKWRLKCLRRVLEQIVREEGSNFFSLFCLPFSFWKKIYISCFLV